MVYFDVTIKQNIPYMEIFYQLILILKDNARSEIREKNVSINSEIRKRIYYLLSNFFSSDRRLN